MKTELRTDWTVEDVCKDFYFDINEGRGLYGLGGDLVIQPEFQRHYIYDKDRKDVAVIDSILKGYPIGLIYFTKSHSEDPNYPKYELLDGQQRITSLGRYKTDMFSVDDGSGLPKKFKSLPDDLQEKIDKTPLTIYICDGTESEIKEWFRTINIGGVPLKDQELLNAIYSGPFVTAAKKVFSNSKNNNLKIWENYISGDVKRQDYLAKALEWVSKGNVEEYMNEHRNDHDIDELQSYFDAVIGWIKSTFAEEYPEMRNIKWGELYEKYHERPYRQDEVSKKVADLYGDYYVKKKAGIFEYVLGGSEDTKLLNVRLFDEPTKKAAYKRQTDKAKAEGHSNCRMCVEANGKDKDRIWPYKQMEADHVTAWSKGGATDISNCEMLCADHNRMKGNK